MHIQIHTMRLISCKNAISTASQTTTGFERSLIQHSVHQMGKSGMRNIVQQTRRLFPQAPAQPPNQQHHPHGMLQPGDIPFRPYHHCRPRLVNLTQTANRNGLEQLPPLQFNFYVTIDGIFQTHVPHLPFLLSTMTVAYPVAERRQSFHAFYNYFSVKSCQDSAPMMKYTVMLKM
jgi:hypothetical protein